MQTYREMLKLDPGSRVFAFLAEELCTAGKWEEAAEVCRKGLVYHPDHLRARVLLGWALMEMGDADECEQVLGPAVDVFHKNSFIFRMLSEVAVFKGDGARADELEGIYRAFQPPASQGAEAPAVEPETIEIIEEPAPAPTALEAETPKEVPVPETPVLADIEELLDQLPEQPSEPLSRAARMEKFLTEFAEGIDMRAMVPGTPPVLFSDAEKDVLKQFIQAGIAADSAS